MRTSGSAACKVRPPVDRSRDFYHSARVRSGDLFVCLPEHVHGKRYVEALVAGAAAVVTDADDVAAEQATVITVPDTR